VEGPKWEVERPIRSCLSWSKLRTIPFEKQALIPFLSGILLWILRADMDQFRTGWFLESVISAAPS
jgi:hypothetical protein